VIKLKNIEPKYERCKDASGEFILISHKNTPIAEIRIRPGYFEGKRIEELFKVYMVEDCPIDYNWKGFSKTKL